MLVCYDRPNGKSLRVIFIAVSLSGKIVFAILSLVSHNVTKKVVNESIAVEVVVI